MVEKKEQKITLKINNEKEDNLKNLNSKLLNEIKAVKSQEKREILIKLSKIRKEI